MRLGSNPFTCLKRRKKKKKKGGGGERKKKEKKGGGGEENKKEKKEKEKKRRKKKEKGRKQKSSRISNFVLLVVVLNDTPAKEYIFWSKEKSTFSTVSFDPLTCLMRKRKQTNKHKNAWISNFALLVVVFK